MQPFAEMRSLSVVCFARTLGTAAPGQKRKVEQSTICSLLGLSHQGGVHITLLVDNELRLRYNHLNCSAPIQHSISNLGAADQQSVRSLPGKPRQSTILAKTAGDIFG
jgi:hypothetical protein